MKMSKAMQRHIERTQGDIAMSKWAGEILNDFYPGHPWAVHADHLGGIMVIKNLAAAGIYADYGYVIHPQKYPTASYLKARIIQAGGEILERAGLPRGRADGTPVTTVDGIAKKDQLLFVG